MKSPQYWNRPLSMMRNGVYRTAAVMMHTRNVNRYPSPEFFFWTGYSLRVSPVILNSSARPPAQGRCSPAFYKDGGVPMQFYPFSAMLARMKYLPLGG